MPRFLITWECEGRGSAYIVEARELAHATTAAHSYRLPGIRIRVEPLDDDDGTARVPARLSPSPAPKSIGEAKELPAVDEDR